MNLIFTYKLEKDSMAYIGSDGYRGGKCVGDVTRFSLAWTLDETAESKS